MKSIQAIWQGQVVAEANQTIMVEGNHYFPKDALKINFFKKTETTTFCPWKGTAVYYSLIVNDEVNEDAVWAYPEPFHEAAHLKDHFAFWKGVEIVKEEPKVRDKRLADQILAFSEDLQNILVDNKASVKPADVLDRTLKLFNHLGDEGLVHILPESFIGSLSFYNFHNSNNLCFQMDRGFLIKKTNPTFNHVLSHLGSFAGHSFAELLAHWEVAVGVEIDVFLKKVESHGWARVPVLKLTKNDKVLYYSLDVAINKHGEKEELTGYQGQLIDITREIELSEAIKQSNANMEQLLAGLTEGLFYFDREGKVAPERSHALSQILPEIKDAQTLSEIFSCYIPGCGESVEACLRLLWPKDTEHFFSDFETTVTILPKKIIREDRTITMQYRALHNSQGELDKVLCIVSDVSDVLRSEEEARRQLERIDKVSKAAKSKDSFLGFVKEMNTLIKQVEGNSKKQENDSSHIKRDLHTLKGSLGAFGFCSLADIIHDIEDTFAESKINGKQAAWQELWKKFCNCWSAEEEDIKSVLGLSEQKQILLQKKIEQLQAYVWKKGDATLYSLVEALQTKPLNEIFSRYQTLMTEWSKRFSEKAANVVFKEGSCELTPDFTQAVDGALVHIFRNAFDHGIESKILRKKLGKGESGLIEVSAKHSSGHWRISIQDDGAGIDCDTLVKKALDSGLWDAEKATKASDEEKQDLIFEAGLSTKDEVNELSGRGVGMDAVRALIQDLGGAITVNSQLGKGTLFTITIPKSQKKAA